MGWRTDATGLDEMLEQRSRIATDELNRKMHELANTPGACKFVVPDNSMSPEFHAGDIVWYRTMSNEIGDGNHVLETSNGEKILRRIQVMISGKVIVSTPKGQDQELDSNSADGGLVSLGRCFYAWRQMVNPGGAA